MAILKDTTLTMIVRDEEMNPAGGVEKTLRNTLPHVEKAIVADTGSSDNTLSILKKLAKEYSHLDVYKMNWVNFPKARNALLDIVKTTYAFVLDADERLFPEQYKKLNRLKEKTRKHSYEFQFLNIYANGSRELMFDSELHTRLFDVGVFEFNERFPVFERITYVSVAKEKSTINRSNFFHGMFSREVMRTNIPIYHYKISEEVTQRKNDEWYFVRSGKPPAYLHESPLENAKRVGWKEPNPHISP